MRAFLYVLVSLSFLTPPQSTLRFEVTNQLPSASGRLIVVIAKSDRPEPRNTIADAGPNASTIVARDVNDLRSAVINNSAGAFPIQSLDHVPPGISLPKDVDGATNRHFPLRISIGGYGARYTAVQRLMRPGSEFQRMWLSDDTPRFVYLHLDGDGPYGDPYQVNSDNSGPYGDALTTELIPYIEKRFRVIAEPRARVLDGGSTGGWVSLALKIFYPDFFNAVWSSCPDGVDFRAFQIIDIYKDKNAYFDEQGNERPSKREINGQVEFSIRHECQMENVMGLGDSWTMSGQQWGAWNATYGPRGADGQPVPLWDPKTGLINKSVVDHWKKYDLRLILEQNWKTLAPKLRGKIHISVGDVDSYYLNNAVHLLDEFLNRAEPPADARIVYGPGRGHCWSSLSETEMMKEMAVAVEGALPGWREQKSGTTARLRGLSA